MVQTRAEADIGCEVVLRHGGVIHGNRQWRIILMKVNGLSQHTRLGVSW
jgi:hypothetical protein